MNFWTMDALISRTLTRLTMASGIGSQTYAEDRVAASINEAFFAITRQKFWRDYTTTATFTLNGTTGEVTASLAGIITNFNDIQYVWTGQYDGPIPQVPLLANPSLVRRASYTRSATANKIFKILPITTAGDVIVRYRTLFDDEFEGSDIVPMDPYILINGAAYDILVDEGTNDSAAQKFFKKYQQLYDIFKHEQEPQVQSIESYDSPWINNTWSET